MNEFKYLGTVFSRSEFFYKVNKHLAQQAQESIYSIIRNIRLFNLSIEQQFDLFDIVVPLLLYGCEIWDNVNIGISENIDLKFLKYVLCFKSSTSFYMVYDESGRYPLYVTRMISYWTKMIHSQDNKILLTVYNCLSNPWIVFI